MMHDSNSKKLELILLVEDNEDHIEHTVDALNEGGLINCIRVVNDGLAALDYLHQRGEYAAPGAAPRPGLILLDVKLPKHDGFEVLEIVKTDPNLKTIPVIMLTTTGNQEDIERGALLGANDYIVKPIQFDDFIRKVKGIGKYWAMISNLAR
jgi:CheY-like chemotaxis protein